MLQYLVDNDAEMNPSVLADTLGYTRPRMTRILDSLVAKGYVERKNDSNDRRKVLVAATEAGREHTESTSGGGVAAVASQLSAWVIKTCWSFSTSWKRRTALRIIASPKSIKRKRQNVESALVNRAYRLKGSSVSGAVRPVFICRLVLNRSIRNHVPTNSLLRNS